MCCKSANRSRDRNFNGQINVEILLIFFNLTIRKTRDAETHAQDREKNKPRLGVFRSPISNFRGRKPEKSGYF